MPRSASHVSKGGTTSARLERLGREMMPIFRIVGTSCMCESDSTLANFYVRAENILDYLLRPPADWGVSPDILSPRMCLLTARSKLLFRAGRYQARFPRSLFLHGPIRIAASPESKSWRPPWLRLRLGPPLFPR